MEEITDKLTKGKRIETYFDDLKIDMNLSIAEGRYICPICKQDLKSWGHGLKKHYPSCKLYGPFITTENSCNVCGRDFVYRRDVFTHLRLSHKELFGPSDDQVGQNEDQSGQKRPILTPLQSPSKKAKKGKTLEKSEKSENSGKSVKENKSKKKSEKSAGAKPKGEIRSKNTEKSEKAAKSNVEIMPEKTEKSKKSVKSAKSTKKANKSTNSSGGDAEITFKKTKKVSEKVNETIGTVDGDKKSHSKASKPKKDIIEEKDIKKSKRTRIPSSRMNPYVTTTLNSKSSKKVNQTSASKTSNNVLPKKDTPKKSEVKRPLIDITNQKPKIRNVFLCHRCAGEFNSKQERSIHKCLSDLIIEEVQGNFNPGQPELEAQTEPIITFPEETEIEAEHLYPKLEQRKEDPKALTTLRQCPLCMAKFGNIKEVQHHMYVFHVITLENQQRLLGQGLSVAEIDISHL